MARWYHAPLGLAGALVAGALAALVGHAARVRGPFRSSSGKLVMPVTIHTRSGGNARHGVNTNERVLTADAVRARGIVRARTLQVEGDARGVEAQPLVVPSVTVNGSRHELVLLASMANVIEAFDAATGASVWRVQLATPIKGTRAIDGWMINDHWGILSTPAYDPDTGRLYACAWQSPDGGVADARFVLYALDVATGHVLATCDLTGTTCDPGHGLPVQRFSAAQRKQRCSLLLLNGRVYLGFGTVAETSSTAQGWIIAVDAPTMTVASALVTTVRGSGAGIWMAGQGLSADAAGNVYCMTGNGDFDGVTDFGECLLKIGWSDGCLAVLDWWCAFSDQQRVGKPIPGVDAAHQPAPRTVEAMPATTGMNMAGMPGMDMSGMMNDDDDPTPTNVRGYAVQAMQASALGVPSGSISMGAAADMDLGSGGAQPIDKWDVVLGAGKDGIAYLARKSAMGRTTPADLGSGRNYQQLAAPPIFFTYYAPDKSPAPANVADLNFLYGGKTHHQHSTPVYHEGSPNGDVVFTWGENGTLKAYRLDAGGLTWLADGAEYASVECAQPPGGMPGAMLFLSSTAAQNAVLWACVPYGDANMTVTSGRLIAYDANDLSGGTLKVLWDSQRWNVRFVYNKFCVPVVANSRLYVPTYSGGVDVYQLTGWSA